MALWLSFIMSFEKEEKAFLQFNSIFPQSFLLVDTYNTLNAVKAIIRLGIKVRGIRLDSGELCSESVTVRNLLDLAEAKVERSANDGDTKYAFTNTKIMAWCSNSSTKIWCKLPLIEWYLIEIQN